MDSRTPHISPDGIGVVGTTSSGLSVSSLRFIGQMPIIALLVHLNLGNFFSTLHYMYGLICRVSNITLLRKELTQSEIIQTRKKQAKSNLPLSLPARGFFFPLLCDFLFLLFAFQPYRTIVMKQPISGCSILIPPYNNPKALSSSLLPIPLHGLSRAIENFLCIIRHPKLLVLLSSYWYYYRTRTRPSPKTNFHTP